MKENDHEYLDEYDRILRDTHEAQFHLFILIAGFVVALLILFFLIGFVITHYIKFMGLSLVAAGIIIIAILIRNIGKSKEIKLNRK